jgi:hypothetical protein
MAAMKYFTLVISLAFCSIFIILSGKVSNSELLTQGAGVMIESNGSDAVTESHRLRLSDAHAVMITATLDSDGKVEMWEEIVPALPSDRYAVLDLRGLQQAAFGNQDFENVALQVLSPAGRGIGMEVVEYNEPISSVPPGNIYTCECKSEEGEDEACKVKKGKKSKVYCEAKSSECATCSLIVTWDDERLVNENNKHSAIIFNH